MNIASWIAVALARFVPPATSRADGGKLRNADARIRAPAEESVDARIGSLCAYVSVVLRQPVVSVLASV